MSRSGFGCNIIILFIFSSATLVIIPAKCYSAGNKTEDEITSLFVFGDSLFDVGNNNYINTTARANYFPYGETYFHYPTGRFSDGRVIPDFIGEPLKYCFNIVAFLLMYL